MKLYETKSWGTDIKEIEAIEIKGSRYYYLDYNGRKTWSNTRSYFTSVHETKEAAISYLKARALIKLNDAKRRVDDAQKELDKLNQIYP